METSCCDGFAGNDQLLKSSSPSSDDGPSSELSSSALLLGRASCDDGLCIPTGHDVFD